MDSAKRIMNGTHGQLWEDGDMWAECTAFQVKVSKTYEDKARAGLMATDRKLVSVKITGSITVDKVYTRHVDDIVAAMAGKDIRHTLVGELDDPDAYGAERIAVYGVSFDDQTLADWAMTKSGTVTLPFAATGFKYLDTVEA